MTVPAGPWLILVPGLAARLLPSGDDGASPWRSRVDLPLAVASGAAGGLLLAFGFARRFAVVYPLSASDFGQYCEVVDALVRGEGAGLSTSRSVIAAWLPAALTGSLGLIDALAVSALLGSMVICGAVYLWARTLWSPLAGIATVLLTGAMGPLAVLPRDVSFYPAIIASSALAAAGVAACFRFRGPAPAALAGAGIALGLLVDIRGVLLGAALVGPALIAALARAASPRGAALRAALVLVPLVASWWIARAVLPEHTAGLEGQAWNQALTATVDNQQPSKSALVWESRHSKTLSAGSQLTKESNFSTWLLKPRVAALMLDPCSLLCWREPSDATPTSS